MYRRWLPIMGILLLVINACSDPSVPLPPSTLPNPELRLEDDPAFSRYPVPVPIRIAMDIPALDNNPVNRYIQELTNIQIVPSWEAEGKEAYDQMVELAIASKDLPDVMVVDRNQLRRLMEKDLIQDLGSVYEDYASKLVKDIYSSYGDEILADVRARGGELMALPNIAFEADSPSLLWIRQDWLDKLKLAPPKSLEELEIVIRAFIKSDPDGDGLHNTVGLCGYRNIVYGQKPALCGFDSIFQAFGAFPKIWTKEASGDIRYGSLSTPNTAALALLGRWYKEGLIDPRFALYKNAQEPIVTNRTGLFFGPWWVPFWPLGDSVTLDPAADWRAYAVPLNQHGEFVTHMAPVTDRFLVVRKGYSKPEAALKILNITTRLERKQDPNQAQYQHMEATATKAGIQLRSYYPIDLLLDYSNAVEKHYADVESVRLGSRDPESLEVETRIIYDRILKEQKNPRADLHNWMTALAYESGIKAIVHTPLRKERGIFYGTTASMGAEWSRLEQLENDTFLKIVIGELPLEAYDTFVHKWLEIGGNKITAEVKEAVASRK